MGQLRCVDGSCLVVTPVACLDSVGEPYEVTLELRRDGVPYGTVGERCGWFLARLARGVAQARADRTGRWPDPDDRFPEPPGRSGPGDGRGEGRRDGCADEDGELFAFRYRSRRGVLDGGELRCRLRTIPVWAPGERGGAGGWRLTRRALLEAWGSGGVGLRAVLTSAELAGFVQELVEEAEECLRPRVPGGAART
ncbi:hypothetical protein ACFOWE_08770 [Planomonospora corallina]|uniref:Uncharacterized protein n=1 Tax=Planomonospora corallina TaxID=1806052 RepID=A0ABV8I3B5_9ACTN